MVSAHSRSILEKLLRSFRRAVFKAFPPFSMGKRESPGAARPPARMSGLGPAAAGRKCRVGSGYGLGSAVAGGGGKEIGVSQVGVLGVLDHADRGSGGQIPLLAGTGRGGGPPDSCRH